MHTYKMHVCIYIYTYTYIVTMPPFYGFTWHPTPRCVRALHLTLQLIDGGTLHPRTPAVR